MCFITHTFETKANLTTRLLKNKSLLKKIGLGLTGAGIGTGIYYWNKNIKEKDLKFKEQRLKAEKKLKNLEKVNEVNEEIIKKQNKINTTIEEILNIIIKINKDIMLSSYTRIFFELFKEYENHRNKIKEELKNN